MKRSVTLGDEQIQVLDVPYVTQRPYIGYCFVAALKMSWDYVRTLKQADQPALDPPELPMETLANLTRADPLTGATLSDEFIKRFNAEQDVVDAQLHYGLTQEQLDAAMSRNLPVIIGYYPSMCEHPGTTTSGTGHACVYLGATKDAVLIHNPWYGPFHTWPRHLYEASRSAIGQVAITFRWRTRLPRTVDTGGEEE